MHSAGRWRASGSQSHLGPGCFQLCIGTAVGRGGGAGRGQEGTQHPLVLPQAPAPESAADGPMRLPGELSGRRSEMGSHSRPPLLGSVTWDRLFTSLILGLLTCKMGSWEGSTMVPVESLLLYIIVLVKTSV